MKKILKFKDTNEKKATDSSLIEDQGILGNLKYVIYSRGVIHILDDEFTFKKDFDLFGKEINAIDFR